MRRSIKKLNIRQKQFYAALCLKSYCRHFKISHTSIDELIIHLLELSTAESLPDWEEKGRCLEISGKGYPLPLEVLECVPEKRQEEFSKLIEYSIEVGIVDLFGAPTGYPASYLDKCISILRSNGVNLPDVKPIMLAWGKDSWGPRISDYILENFIKFNLK